MTFKRWILTGLTILAIALVGLSLVSSWNQPQVQSRLELYQTNLLLHGAEWQGGKISEGNERNFANPLVGADPYKAALEQYETTRESTQELLEQTRSQLNQLETKKPPVTPTSENPQLPAAPINQAVQSYQKQRQQLQAAIAKLEVQQQQINLRLGILQAQKQDPEAAIATWQTLSESANPQMSAALTQDSVNPEVAQTARVLIGLWSDRARILPDAEGQIQKNLEGWFRYRALNQLYTLQERQDSLATLQASEQIIAQQAIFKLAIIVGIRAVGFVIGVILLIILVVQWFFQRKESILTNDAAQEWSTPWDWEIVWQVLIVGFFLVGQLLVPLFFDFVNSLLNLQPGELGVRGQGFYILASYTLLAAGGLGVLYLSLKPFLPLPEGWFRIDWRGNWFWWGLGGYCAALPLVILVSVLNEQIWQGKGGSNPIIPIALEGRDSVAIALFVFTASIAAPLFEELMFRGFLLPSLTRYLPVNGAIALSSLLFAVAHLKASEVLPLAVLGAVLGFIYTRSRNLLAPMFLHCLWNSGTLLSLFVLGSSATL